MRKLLTKHQCVELEACGRASKSTPSFSYPMRTSTATKLEWLRLIECWLDDDGHTVCRITELGLSVLGRNWADHNVARCADKIRRQAS